MRPMPLEAPTHSEGVLPPPDEQLVSFESIENVESVESAGDDSGVS